MSLRARVCCAASGNLTCNESTRSLRRRSDDLAIGVFDSGVGGLTVLRALLERLPHEDFVYLGDTARLPYGTKSPGSIRQYSLQAARQLHARGVKCLVVACNTASAIALDALTQEFAPVPVIGVLEPGAAAACRATRTRAHRRARDREHRARRRLPGRDRAPAAGRGRHRARVPAVRGARGGGLDRRPRRRGRDPSLPRRRVRPGDGRARTRTRCCSAARTFPVLAPALARVLGPGIAIVDSAATTAASLDEVLAARGLARTGGRPRRPNAAAGDRRRGTVRTRRRRVPRPAARGAATSKSSTSRRRLSGLSASRGRDRRQEEQHVRPTAAPWALAAAAHRLRLT